MDDRDWNWRTEHLHAVVDLVDGLAEIEETVPGELRVESVGVGFPVEIATSVDEHGSLTLAVAPPEQVDTSHAPTLHSLTLYLQVERGS